MKRTIIRVLIIVTLFTGNLLSVYSQNTNMPIKQNDIDKLNKRITKLLNKSNCKKPERTKLINIFYVAYKGSNNKNNFINESFEQYIEPSYFNYKSKKYLQTESFICNEDGELIALSDGRCIYCLSDYDESAYIGDIKLVHKIIELDLKVIYYLSLTPLKTYLCIGGNEKTYLIRVRGKNLNTYLIKDIPNNKWSDLFKL